MYSVKPQVWPIVATGLKFGAQQLQWPCCLTIHFIIKKKKDFISENHFWNERSNWRMQATRKRRDSTSQYMLSFCETSCVIQGGRLVWYASTAEELWKYQRTGYLWRISVWIVAHAAHLTLSMIWWAAFFHDHLSWKIKLTHLKIWSYCLVVSMAA